jgi:FkbM family methyltransferase
MDSPLLRRLVPQAVKDAIANAGRKTAGVPFDVFEAEFLGERLKVAKADELSIRWYGAGWQAHERREFSFLRAGGVPDNGLVFDIGAHQGVVAMLCGRLLVPNGRIVAVEMDDLNAAACEFNLRNNGLAGASLVHAAVADREAHVRRAGRSNARISTEKSFVSKLYPSTVSRTLDGLCGEFGIPDLIYMDIEGAEVLALKGANACLGKTRQWYVEVHGDEACGNFGGSNRSVVQTLADAGYELYFSEDEAAEIKPLRSLDDVPSVRFNIVARSPAPSCAE